MIAAEEHKPRYSEELLVLQQQQSMRVQLAVLLPLLSLRVLYPQQHGHPRYWPAA